MNKKLLILGSLGIIVVGAIAAFFFYREMTKRPAFSEIKAGKGTVQAVLNLNGKVAPQDSVELGFEIGGKITQLTHAVGDEVTSGTPLAYANDADLVSEYQEAQDLVDSADATLDQYEKAVNREKAKLKSLKKQKTGVNTSDIKAQREQINVSQEQVESQEANLRAAEANVATTKAQIDKTVIVAPFDGIITKQDPKVGEVAQSNVPFITLASQNNFKIEVFVSQIDIPNIHEGSAAQVTLDNVPDREFSATVTAIDPAESVINNISNYKVTLNFTAVTPELRSGVGTNVTLTSESQENTVLVPKDALYQDNNRSYVFVSQNGTRQVREVQTGIYGSNGMVEITKGLNAGEIIFEPANQ